MSIVEPCVLELLKHADSRYTLVVERSDYLRRTERRKRGSGRRCAVNFPTCADGMWCWA